MSSQNPATVNCPACNHQQDVVIWNSLNVQVDPEAKEDLFTGKINVFKCEACAAEAGLNAEFMYHDMELQFCVQYMPPEALEYEEALESYEADGTLNPAILGPMATMKVPGRDVTYMLRPHVVFNMGEMLYYIIFREKLAARSQ